MNHIDKIQSWTGLLVKNRIFLSIFYHLNFVQKVNFELLGGQFLASFRPLHLTT